jgi:hypothetical protein
MFEPFSLQQQFYNLTTDHQHPNHHHHSSSPATSTFILVSYAMASVADLLALDYLDYLLILSSVSVAMAARTLDPPSTMCNTSINMHMGKEVATGLHISPLLI